MGAATARIKESTPNRAVDELPPTSCFGEDSAAGILHPIDDDHHLPIPERNGN